MLSAPPAVRSFYVHLSSDLRKGPYRNIPWSQKLPGKALYAELAKWFGTGVVCAKSGPSAKTSASNFNRSWPTHYECAE